MSVEEKGLHTMFVKREDLQTVINEDVNFLEKIDSFLDNLEGRGRNKGLNIADGTVYANENKENNGGTEEREFIFDKERKLKILKMPPTFSRSTLNKSKWDIASGFYNWTIEVKVENAKAELEGKKSITILDDINEGSLVWQVICEKLNIWPVSIHLLSYNGKSGTDVERRTVEASDTFSQVLRDATIIEFPSFVIVVE